MKLRHVDISNFRGHRSLALDFDTGMTCVRGANESGKTSIIEAVMYALYGGKALRTSLENAVTWGEDAKKLKVALTVEFDSKLYTFTRSKSGAEVTVGGEVYVTGQTEVANFAQQIIGADLNLASRLMFSGQNSIRAALEEGPKALSVLIENLSGMETFDTILEKAQETLSVGSTAAAEARLATFQAELDKLHAEAPKEPIEAVSKAKIEMLEFDIAKLETERDAVAKQQEADHVALSDLSSKYLERLNVQDEVTALFKQHANLLSKVEALRNQAAATVDNAKIAEMEAAIKHAEGWKENKVLYANLLHIIDGERFDGTADGFATVLADAQAQEKASASQIRQIEVKIAALQAKRINHDTCDKCGQDITHLEHVITTNAQIDERVQALSAELIGLGESNRESADRLSRLNSIAAYAGKFASEIVKFGDKVTLDESVYPAKATWKGRVPSGAEPVAPVEELKLLIAQRSAVERAVAQLEMLEVDLAEMAASLTDKQAALAKLEVVPESEIQSLTNKVKAADNRFAEITVQQVALRNQIAEERNALSSAQVEWDKYVQAGYRLQGYIGEAESEIETTKFNNALLKKLRLLRPVIADKIWNTVLASVSVMFSQIRGVQSSITKVKDGFLCNGQAVESLSGSTLDALGLAIRCALLRTFIPHCDVLVLDEPAHGMDENRTTALLGFIKALNLGQTVLITHEDVSATVAATTVTLGE